MESHFQLNDDQFKHQFEDLSLDPGWFSHEAHLRLAWVHIRTSGVTNAIDSITHQIKAFAKYHGDADKYNETVTVAAVRTVYHFMLKSSSSSFADFIAEFPRLKYEFKSLLNSHYSIDLFKSDAAKSTFIEPDLLPYDTV